jgi:cytochrome c biogenesis protein ResB
VSKGKKLLTIVYKEAGSARLALILVGLLILLSAAGAMLPQEGMHAPSDIARWQEEHTFLSSVMKPLGLFRAFHSLPFIILIILLGINTLTCTLTHFIKRGGIASFKGPDAVKNTGFILLHLSLILLFAGGAWSASARMDGFIVLTEGQGFKEEHRNYLHLAEGPLRREKHKGFLLTLKNVRIVYQEGKYVTKIAAGVEVGAVPGRMAAAEISVNHPLTYRGVDFTLDQVGFSPRLVILDKKSGKPLINSFVALKTFRKGPNREYKDFLPLPFFKNRVIVTLYPAYRIVENKIIKSGEEPENPILLIEVEGPSGEVELTKHLPFKGKTGVGDHMFEFIELRRWASFKVVEDPGYPVVWLAVLLGLLALFLRYIPELTRWFSKKDEKNIQGAGNGTD